MMNKAKRMVSQQLTVKFISIAKQELESSIKSHMMLEAFSQECFTYKSKSYGFHQEKTTRKEK